MKIDWYGNIGRCCPKPGTLDEVRCGVCGAKMNARRNVMGPAGMAEALAGRKHLHDVFACPSINKAWHERIVQLKMSVCAAEINHKVDYQKKKRAAAKEIRKLLKKHAAG